MTNYLVTYKCVVTADDDLSWSDIASEGIMLWQQGIGQMEVEIDG